MPEINQAVAASLPRRTGVTLSEWSMLLEIEGPSAQSSDQVAFLTERYGLSAEQAEVIVAFAQSTSVPKDDPIADKLFSAAQSLGVDVRVERRTSSAPLFRRREFAVLKRSGDDHIDLGLALPGTKHTGRLVPVRRSDAAARITHHVEISRSEEVDSEILGWLRKAYELDR